MTLFISPAFLQQVNAFGESAYPDESAGLILGVNSGGNKLITRLLAMENAREAEARRRRYLLTHEDYQHGEEEADRLGVEVLGVFHSHPDHPSQPSDFDLEWALPAFTYLITSVQQGKAADSRCWSLNPDRSRFEEEPIEVLS